MKNIHEKQAQLLQKAAFTFDGCLTNPMEGFVLGNGDMAAIVTAMQHEVRFHMTKSDCWDARYDNDHRRDTMHHDDLIKWERAYGFQWPTPVENDMPKPIWRENPENIQVPYASATFGDYMHGPNPKPMGTFIVRHNGLYGIKISGKLDISTGVFCVTYGFDKGVLQIQAFISRNDNVMHVRVSKEGTVPKLQLILEKYPDNSGEGIPLPVHGSDNEHSAWMQQVIPAGCDVDEFGWCLAANYPTIKSNGFTRGSYRIYQKHKLDRLNFQTIRTVTLDETDTFDCMIAAATSRQNGAEYVNAAKCLAGFGTEPDYDKAFSVQKAAMGSFWKRSGVWLEEEKAAAIWYRGIYEASVFIGDNGTFPGLVCNIPTQDYSPWHGATAWNMNIQRWTVYAFATNHLEWIEAYCSMLEENKPIMELYAKENFGLDGICLDFITIPFVPPHRNYVNNKWGRSMSILGWCMQPLWFYYEFTKDEKWLRERAYPFLRDAAVFYAGFVRKYKQGGDLYPSMMIGEGPGWMPDFKGNRNLTDDLAVFEQSFRYALEAAQILNCDESLQMQWKDALEQLPPIRYSWDGKEGKIAYGYSNELGYTDDDLYYLSPYLHGKWKSVEDFPLPSETAAMWLIYPFEYLTGDGESDLEKAAAWRIRNMYDYTHHPNPFNECHVSVSYGALLRVDGRKWYNHTIRAIEENILESGEYYAYGDVLTRKDSGFVGRMPETYVHPVQYVSDIMLQSQGGIIRIFPALPRQKSGAFSGFRARGGFVVSAETDGQLLQAQILSTLGGICRIKIDGREICQAPDGAWEENGRLCFETVPNQTYVIEMKP